MERGATSNLGSYASSKYLSILEDGTFLGGGGPGDDEADERDIELPESSPSSSSWGFVVVMLVVVVVVVAVSEGRLLVDDWADRDRRFTSLCDEGEV